MRRDPLEAARSELQRLQHELAAAEAEVEKLEARRAAYEARVEPVVAEAQEVITDTIEPLRDWRQDFAEAADTFATDEVGALGRRLREIETRLFKALHRVVATAHEAKREEVGIGSGPDESLERLQHCEPAARNALVRAGGGDSRLDVWRGLDGEVATRFRHQIISYFADQNVRIYQPGRGLKQFRR